MSAGQPLLVNTAERLFADLARERDADFHAVWSKIEASELQSLLTPESDGGFGGDWSDAFAVIRLAAAAALALPIGEAIAARALIGAGEGWATLAERAEGVLDGAGRFTGRVACAGWGRDANAVLVDLESALLRLPTADAEAKRQLNPAGEARDVLTFAATPARTIGAAKAFVAGAFVRTAQISGALDAALAMSIGYANERVQFGKPIGKFQAVQQSLAVFAEEAAAVACAGQAAAGGGSFEIGAAKLRANMAAAIGAATAHQVHGAIGFTQEHGLQPLTRRLIAWRSEFGGEAWWSESIGKGVCGRGADMFWPFLTGVPNSSEARA